MRSWKKLNYSEFQGEINSGNLKTAYLIHGKEDYLIDKSLKLVLEKYIDPNFEALNYIQLEGSLTEFDDILNACETLPFMSEKKLVVVRDSIIFQANNNLEARAKDMRKKLKDYIPKLNRDTTLLIVEKSESIIKNNAVYKTINTLGGVVEMEKLKKHQLESFVEKQFKSKGKTISRVESNYFIQKTSYLDKNMDKSLYDIENEVSKIVNYLEDSDEVKKTHIDELLSNPLDVNIFNLLGFIARKNGREALRVFNEMYSTGEASLFILHMIVRQFRNLLYFRVLKEKGYDDGSIRSKMKVSSYEYSKIANEKGFNINQLEEFLTYCVDIDEAIKRGRYDDRLALEILISKLCFYNV